MDGYYSLTFFYCLCIKILDLYCKISYAVSSTQNFFSENMCLHFLFLKMSVANLLEVHPVAFITSKDLPDIGLSLDFFNLSHSTSGNLEKANLGLKRL